MGEVGSLIYLYTVGVTRAENDGHKTVTRIRQCGQPWLRERHRAAEIACAV